MTSTLFAKAKDAFEATKKYEQQVVTIVGESVSFVPTGLSEGETVIVEFEKYYKPEDISEEDYQILVKTMRTLFDGKRKAVADPTTGEDSDKFVNEALPPCSEKEKFLVLESLLFRKRVLLQQLYNQGILTPEEMKKKINEMRTSKRDESVEGKETLFVRNLLIHLLRLEKFIKFYVETQSCINVEDIVNQTLELDLTDDRIKELLKQFVFFLLQSSHPLKDYTKIHPTAPAFVARLEKNLLKDKFPKFLETYKNNKFPIPVTLAKVLEATDVDPEALKKQANDAIIFERLKIIKHIRDIIPATDPFWKRIGDPEDPVKIVDALKERNDSLMDEIKRLESQRNDLDKKLKTCEQGQRALQAEKNALQARIAELEALLKTRTDQATQIQQLRDEKAAIEADFNRRFQDLHYQIFFCEEEKRTLEQRVAELTRINQALNDEIVPLRQSAQRLAELQAEVDRNLEDLRRRHQAALAEEQARTAEKEEARAAAVAATEEARNQLIAKQEELVRAETTLQAVRDSIVEKDRSIANLQRTLNECEGNVANLREQIQAKNEEIRRLNAELQQARDRITALEEELRNLRQQIADANADTGLLREEVRQAQEMIEKLTNELQAEKAKVQEKEIALKACEEEKARLKSTASGSSQEVAKLASDLAATKEERDIANAKIGVLEATVKSLQEQLADSNEEKSAQRALIAERDETIRSLEEDLDSKTDDLEQKTGEAEAEKQRANAAEGSVARLEDEKRRLILNSERRLEETRTQLQKTFDEGLEKVRVGYEENLSKAVSEEKRKCDEERQKWSQDEAFLQEKIRKILENIEVAKRGVAEAKANYERILAEEKQKSDQDKRVLEAEKRVALEDKQKAEDTLARIKGELDTLKARTAGTETEKDKILKVVKDIASWIDSGEEPDAIDIGEDTPASSELRAILTKLSEETPATPTSPTTEKVKSVTYLCYLVFLTAFLWQTNFPKLSDTPPTDVIQLDSYKRQKLVQNIFPALFNGGTRPQAEMWAEPTGTAKKTSILSSAYLFKTGLYEDIHTLSAGRTTKAKFEGKLQVERDIAARYLNILNKIARAMETPAKDGSILGLLPMDIVYIEELFKKLKVLIGEYKTLYDRLDLETHFASLVGNLMIVNQPLINGTLLNRYLVQDEEGVRIVTKTEKDSVEPSTINYAVIFYCFLVVMRDNLNHIQNTAKTAQCPLPPFLVKPPHNPKK